MQPFDLPLQLPPILGPHIYDAGSGSPPLPVPIPNEVNLDSSPHLRTSVVSNPVAAALGVASPSACPAGRFAAINHVANVSRCIFIVS